MARFGKTEANREEFRALLASAVQFFYYRQESDTARSRESRGLRFSYGDTVLSCGLLAPGYKRWWAIKDLNLGPLPCEGSALTN